jgi:CBS domain-containing protein
MTCIAHFMTREPICVAPQDSLQHAAHLMDEFNVGALPVCQDGQLIGIVTDRDITVRATAAGLNPAVTPVDQVMTDRVRCCSHKQSAAEALTLMTLVQIRRLPVVDDSYRLLGMVSLGDLAAYQTDAVQEALRGICTPSEPDRAALAA